MQIDINQVAVRNNPETHRFETTVNGYEAFNEYQIRGDRILFLHTEVPDEIGGNGIAAKIAQTALDYARAKSLVVLPYCPYFKAFIRQHPAYQELVQAGFSLSA